MNDYYTEDSIDWNKYIRAARSMHLFHETGKVVRVVGFLIEAYIPGACVGSICEIYPMGTSKSLHAEVVGFRDKKVLLMPMGNVRGIKMGSEVFLKQLKVSVRISDKILGRVVNAECVPIDNKGPLEEITELHLYRHSYDSLSRRIINEPVDLGVKAVNGLICAGVGQRLGIFAAAGCGKSVLLGMMARNTDADVNVVCLVGERSREVKNFIEKEIGTDAMAKTILVVATSDDSPILRVRAAYLATSIAEYFRDKGKKVLFLMDSVTRFSMAMREIGLAIGEPPATKGYPPSVFSELPKLFERVSTTSGEGSITGLYTVLMETEDLEDPVAEVVKSIIDGHIQLTKKLAMRSHYPAIDVLQSVSRVMVDVVSEEHLRLALEIRKNLALYRDVEDLINLGAYVSGSNSEIDYAIKVYPRIKEFLIQGMTEKSDMNTTINKMREIFIERNVNMDKGE
jgi:flagellum-specific ATP synthase